MGTRLTASARCFTTPTVTTDPGPNRNTICQKQYASPGYVDKTAVDGIHESEQSDSTLWGPNVADDAYRDGSPIKRLSN